MIPILNTCAISFETLVGIWIFSKIFPKRDCLQKRQVAAELIFWMFFLFVMFHNWGQNIPLILQLCLGGLCSARIVQRPAADLPMPNRQTNARQIVCFHHAFLLAVSGAGNRPRASLLEWMVGIYFNRNGIDRKFSFASLLLSIPSMQYIFCIRLESSVCCYNSAHPWRVYHIYKRNRKQNT